VMPRGSTRLFGKKIIGDRGSGPSGRVFVHGEQDASSVIGFLLCTASLTSRFIAASAASPR
jgi:hypothetical protein